MANGKSATGAIGSLFGAIASAAGATAQLIDVGAGSIDVLEANVARWRADARLKSLETIISLEETAEQRVALAISEEESRIKKAVARDADLGALYLKNVEKVKGMNIKERLGIEVSEVAVQKVTAKEKKVGE